MNAFEENDPKKAKKAGAEDGDEAVFMTESGKPSPGQLTADKASCLLFSKYLTSHAACFCLFVLLSVLTVHSCNVRHYYFQIKDMMAAAQKMIQERKAQLNVATVCTAYIILSYYLCIEL